MIDDCRKELLCTLNRQNMLGFAKAMMWVMGKVFGLSHKRMLCELDEKRGRRLLTQIIHTDNFAHYIEDTFANNHMHYGRFLNQLITDLELA